MSNPSPGTLKNQNFTKRRSFWTPRDPGNPPKSSVSTPSTFGDVMTCIPLRQGGDFFSKGFLENQNIEEQPWNQSN